MKLTIAFLLTIVILQCLPTSESKSIKKKASEVFNKVVNKIKEKVNALRKEAKAFFKTLKESLKTGITSIKGKIKKLPEKVLRLTFEEIHNGLEKARKKLKETNELADTKFYKAMDKAHEKFFDVTSQIEKFMTKQKVIVEKKEEKDKGIQLLDDFVIKSSEKIESCADAALNPVKELYEKTKAAVNGAVENMEGIIKSSLDCLNQGLKIAACAKEVASTAKSHLSNLGSELMELKSKLLEVAMSEVVNFVCIGKTRADVELDKTSVGQKIKNLK